MNEALTSEVERRYGELIRKFRDHFDREAVVGGGAIRDIILGRPTKDIDIIVEQPMSEYEAAAYFGIPFRRIVISRAQYDDGFIDGHSTLLYALESEDKAMNILVVESVEHKLRSFPDSISMVWFDGERVHAATQFLDTVATGVVRYAPRTTPERLARLKAKYGTEYEFIEHDKEIL